MGRRFAYSRKDKHILAARIHDYGTKIALPAVPASQTSLIRVENLDRLRAGIRLLDRALPQNLWVKGSNISRMEAFGFFAFPR